MHTPNVKYCYLFISLHAGGHIQIGDELLTANKVSLEGTNVNSPILINTFVFVQQ